jgi:hypothetical protein
MRARIMLTALVVLPLAAAPTWAQGYTLKTKSFPDVGKSSKTIDQTTVRTAISLALGDKVLKEDKTVEIAESQFTEKTLKAGTDKPDKYTHAYTKAVKGPEGSPAELSYAGKTIVFERKGDAYVATAEEGGVDAKDLKRFTTRANRPDQTKTILPKTAVKVGDSWTLGKDAAALFATDEDAAESFDGAKLKGQGKLVKAYKKGKEQWGTIAIDLSVPMTKLGPLTLDTPISLQVKMTLDTAIDGSSTAGQGRGTFTLKGKSTITQDGMTFTVDLAVSGEMRRDVTAEE